MCLSRGCGSSVRLRIALSVDEPEFSSGRAAVYDPYMHQVAIGGMGQAEVFALVDDQVGYSAVCASRIALVVCRRGQFLVLSANGLGAIMARLRNGNRLFIGVAYDHGEV